MAEQESELDRLRRQLFSLELRIRRLEAAMAYSGVKAPEGTEEQMLTASPAADSGEDEEKGLESRIGRFGLAWMGNIVLLFGITFLKFSLSTKRSSLFSKTRPPIAQINY